MARFVTTISVAVLVASIAILFNQLFSPQPIQIILETGQEIVTQSPEYFSMTQVLLLITCSFLIGSTAIYLYYRSETDELLKSLGQKRSMDGKYSMVLPLLRSDEKMVLKEIINNKGEMLQNALVLKTRLKKVKMTRVLASLQTKDLIVKERHGLTNNIKLR